MLYPKGPSGWGRFTPAIAFVFFLGCSSSASQPAEPTPSTPEPQGATPAPTAEPSPAPPTTAEIETYSAGEFDNGKMWTFEYAPLEYFRDEYGFSPDSAWFAKARLGALRIEGCSASFVSPSGLVMTNHHCARESVTEVSEPGENLLDNGFYARSLAQERHAENQQADQLIAIIDVTDEINTAIAGATSDAQRGQLLEQAQESVSQRIADERGGSDANTVVEVIELWNGAKYSAYVFRRYSDVRLVLAPELQIAFFGGDPDNFTYPRYNLDMSFYRLYDDGEPVQTDHYFTWSETGASEGDAVFVIGNPGGSSRLQTVSQLEWRSAAYDIVVADLLASRAAIYKEYADANPEEAEELDLRNQIFSWLNSEKAYRGMWEGLQNPEYMGRRRDTERQFREAIESDPTLGAEFGGLLEEMAGIQQQRIDLADEFGAFVAFGNPGFTSAVMVRAIGAYQYLVLESRGAPQEVLSQVQDQLLSVADQPPELQRGLLEARFDNIELHLGADSPIGSTVLQNSTPEEAADAVLAHSVLVDSAGAAAAFEAGAITLDDAAVQVVAAIFNTIAAYQSTFQQLDEQELAVAAELGRAHFEIYGTKYPPDATFSLRIADGVVKGYDYNGTWAPAHTTFYGMYDRHYSFGPDSEWDLPENWLKPPASFDRSKQLNFVFTADIIGGNSGSPVVNPELEVVGLVFDGNIESLPGDYIYDPAINRAVAVDVRGILEALDEMYDADRLVLELTTGQMAETEEEADAVRAGQR
jgi:hypothetical protein